MHPSPISDSDMKISLSSACNKFILEQKNVTTINKFNLKDANKTRIQEIIKIAEEKTNNTEISDQTKYLIDQKIEVLKSIN